MSASASRRVPSLDGGDPQFRVGMARGNGFRQIKAGEMLPDDFIRLVAFNAFRTGIPTDHHSAGVKHQQRMVRNRVHQQAEAFLAGVQAVFRILTGILTRRRIFCRRHSSDQSQKQIAVTTEEAADIAWRPAKSQCTGRRDASVFIFASAYDGIRRKSRNRIITVFSGDSLNPSSPRPL